MVCRKHISCTKKEIDTEGNALMGSKETVGKGTWNKRGETCSGSGTSGFALKCGNIRTVDVGGPDSVFHCQWAVNEVVVPKYGMEDGFIGAA